jgi:hypothetical protein
MSSTTIARKQYKEIRFIGKRKKPSDAEMQLYMAESDPPALASQKQRLKPNSNLELHEALQPLDLVISLAICKPEINSTT